MLVSLKILTLLWLINFAPPLLAHLLGEKWDTPLDAGRSFKDGNPLFGPHKTIRGVLAALLVGAATAWIVGFELWVGFVSGILSMGGDLLSSFIKRRRNLPSGSVVPGLDQVFEGLFPFVILVPRLSLGVLQVPLLVFIFSTGAYVGSKFFKEVLLVKPFEAYPRKLRSHVRLREFRACQITSNPLHHFLNFEDAFYYHVIMESVFRLSGLYGKGVSNALNIKVHNISLPFRDLPASFHGYTILFLADLHLDGLQGLAEQLQRMLPELPADLCIFGGDLRMETHGPFAQALRQLERVIPAIQAKDGIYGVLGNHDCVEIVEPLERIGVSFLVNDARAIERNGECIWLVGVDDPHYYRCHDLRQAFSDVPSNAFSLFVAHSNEVYREASEYGPRLYLCGHSHAGQVQVPPFGPIFTHSRAPRKLCQGAWNYNGMQGYTTCGVGVSGVPVRFNSQGEVVYITLKVEGVPQ